MKTIKNAKRIVFFGGIIFIVFFFLLGFMESKGINCTYQTNEQQSDFGGFIPGGNGERYPDKIYWVRADWCKVLLPILPVFLPLVLFSLLTYKMKDEVFTAWIKFASWWVPIIIFVTYLQNTQTGGGGLGIGGALSSGFDIVVLGFFYFIFIVVSLIIIVKKHMALR